MPETWTLNFEVDTVTKLLDDNTTFELVDDDVRTLLAVQLVDEESSYWDVSGEERVFVTWRHYKLAAVFDADDADDARARAAELRSRIAARLSFMTGGPVRLRKGFSASSAPPEQDQRVGEKYKTIIAVAEYGAGGPEWAPPAPNLERSAQLLTKPSITPSPGHAALVDRAMLWLHASYNADSRFVEFSSLMSGLEALAPALDGPEDQYWACTSCQSVFAECPDCEASTARKSSAAHVLRDFVTRELGWARKDWDRIYNIRSRFRHGDVFPTGEDYLNLADYAPRLEEALLAGLKRVLGWANGPPLPRPRLPFSAAWQAIEWSPGNKKQQ